MSGLFLFLDIFTIFLFTIFFVIFMLFMFNKFEFKNKSLFNFFIINLENSIPLEKILSFKNFMILVFKLIFFINILSLFPHIFSLFSLMNFTLIISISFWMSMMFINFIYFLKSFLIHLTPLTTPLILMSFMVLIELVSQFIRPLTLLVRLGTNLTTGHLILGLISFFSMLSIFIQIPLFLLELMVALVQAYVFTLLVILYFNE